LHQSTIAAKIKFETRQAPTRSLDAALAARSADAHQHAATTQKTQGLVQDSLADYAAPGDAKGVQDTSDRQPMPYPEGSREPEKARRAFRRPQAGPVVIAALTILAASLFVIQRGRRASPMVVVEIRTKPTGATVTVHGITCTSPNCRLDLPAGQFDLEARLDGYRPYKKAIALDGRQRYARPIDVELEPTPPLPSAPRGPKQIPTSATGLTAGGRPRESATSSHEGQKSTSGAEAQQNKGKAVAPSPQAIGLTKQPETSLAQAEQPPVISPQPATDQPFPGGVAPRLKPPSEPNRTAEQTAPQAASHSSTLAQVAGKLAVGTDVWEGTLEQNEKLIIDGSHSYPGKYTGSMFGRRIRITRIAPAPPIVEQIEAPSEANNWGKLALINRGPKRHLTILIEWEEIR
jgi:hypothetical protein